MLDALKKSLKKEIELRRLSPKSLILDATVDSTLYNTRRVFGGKWAVYLEASFAQATDRCDVASVSLLATSDATFAEYEKRGTEFRVWTNLATDDMWHLPSMLGHLKR
jgi:hypothetical protein